LRLGVLDLPALARLCELVQAVDGHVVLSAADTKQLGQDALSRAVLVEQRAENELRIPASVGQSF